MFIEERKSRGHVYLWLTHKGRVNGKSVRMFSVYLGPKESFAEHLENIKLNVKPETRICTYDFGLPVVLMKMVQRLDLINIINECTTKRDQGLSVGHYMVLATLQRCIKPQSKVHIRKWFHSTYLQQLFPEITTYLDSTAYTNHYPYLTEEAIEQIETRIVETLRTEFKVELKELFFDPTNLFTYTNPRRKNQTIFGHGHSKEGRHTLNLVNFSLLCTRDGGIPVMHCTYPGGTHDAAHFKTHYPNILARLKKLKIEAPAVILVFDKGNISPEVFQALDESGIAWLCSVRPSSQKDLAALTSDEFPMIELPNQKKVGVLEKKRPMFSEAALKKSKVPGYENPARRLIIQYNPERANWTGGNLIQKLQARIDTINTFFKGADQRLAHPEKFPKWKKKTAVETKIRKIMTDQGKEHYLDYISSEVKSKEGPTVGDSLVQYEIRLKKEALEVYLKTLGKSYYMTNHPTMTGSEIIWLYRQQFSVEHAFRYLKSPDSLRIRPMWVHTNESVQGYIFTCVFGLLLFTLIVREVKEAFPELGFSTIRELLSEIEVAEIKLSGSSRTIRKMVEISSKAKKLADFYHLEQAL